MSGWWAKGVAFGLTCVGRGSRFNRGGLELGGLERGRLEKVEPVSGGGSCDEALPSG